MRKPGIKARIRESNMTKERSPFTPGRPVPVEFFVGRLLEIDRMVRSVRQVAQGKQENLFLAGERGIGKSSLAAFVRYLAEKDHAFLAVHVYLGGSSTLPEVVQRTFERLLQESASKPFFSKIKSLFADHVKEVGLFGVTLQFSLGQGEGRNLVTNFLPALDRLFDRISDEKKGIMLVLDDINGVTANPQFAHFLKSIVDEIATRHRPLPLLLLLTGLPERRVLDNFLVRMRKLGVLRPGERRGEYVFVNNLFRLYMTLQAAGGAIG